MYMNIQGVKKLDPQTLQGKRRLRNKYFLLYIYIYIPSEIIF